MRSAIVARLGGNGMRATATIVSRVMVMVIVIAIVMMMVVMIAVAIVVVIAVRLAIFRRVVLAVAIISLVEVVQVFETFEGQERPVATIQRQPLALLQLAHLFLLALFQVQAARLALCQLSSVLTLELLHLAGKVRPGLLAWIGQPFGESRRGNQGKEKGKND